MLYIPYASAVPSLTPGADVGNIPRRNAVLAVPPTTLLVPAKPAGTASLLAPEYFPQAQSPGKQPLSGCFKFQVL